MSGERSEAGWLEWLALLGPLAVTFLGAVAIFVAQRSRDGHQLVIWFVVLVPTVVLQVALLLPLGLRWLKPRAEKSFRVGRGVALVLAVAALLLLVLSIPAQVSPFH